MRQVFNPPPGWPPAPEGWVPPDGWSPDPTWPDPPDGWQLWRTEPEPERRRRWATPLVGAVALLVGIAVGAGGSPSQAGELDEAMTTAERLTDENTALADQVEALEADVGELRTQLGTAEAEVARLASEAQAVAAQTADLAAREAALAQRQGEVDAAAAAVAQREAAVAAAPAARPPASSGAAGSDAAGVVTGAFQNCDAARAAGAAPVLRGEPGYGPHLDRDDDGVGCE